MSAEKEANLRVMASLLANIVSAIAIGLCGWTASELVKVKENVAALRAAMPTEYPPKWFLDRYERDLIEKKEAIKRIEDQVRDNYTLMLKMQKEAK